MLSRRSLLKKSLMGAGVGVVASQSVAAGMCVGVTPKQGEGPFYPVSAKIEADNDLTQLEGNPSSARGEVVIIKGVVSGKDCKPIAGALVEIWQACDTGKYNHPNDPNTADLDKNFQYFGRSITDANGVYMFKTIRPGQYPAGDGWIRPSHVHYKVHLRGYEELTTQMYFKGDPYNAADFLLQGVPKAEQEKLIVDFTSKNAQGLSVGQFDITLNKIITSR